MREREIELRKSFYSRRNPNFLAYKFILKTVHSFLTKMRLSITEKGGKKNHLFLISNVFINLDIFFSKSAK